MPRNLHWIAPYVEFSFSVWWAGWAEPWAWMWIVLAGRPCQAWEQYACKPRAMFDWWAAEARFYLFISHQGKTLGQRPRPGPEDRILLFDAKVEPTLHRMSKLPCVEWFQEKKIKMHCCRTYFWFMNSTIRSFGASPSSVGSANRAAMLHCRCWNEGSETKGREISSCWFVFSRQAQIAKTRHAKPFS